MFGFTGKKERERRAYAAAVQKACDEARESVQSLNVIQMGYRIPPEIAEIDPDDLVERYLAPEGLDEASAQTFDHYLDQAGRYAKQKIDRERLDEHDPTILTAQASLEHIEYLIGKLEDARKEPEDG